MSERVQQKDTTRLRGASLACKEQDQRQAEPTHARKSSHANALASVGGEARTSVSIDTVESGLLRSEDREMRLRTGNITRATWWQNECRRDCIIRHDLSKCTRQLHYTLLRNGQKCRICTCFYTSA